MFSVEQPAQTEGTHTGSAFHWVEWRWTVSQCHLLKDRRAHGESTWPQWTGCYQQISTFHVIVFQLHLHGRMIVEKEDMLMTSHLGYQGIPIEEWMDVREVKKNETKTQREYKFKKVKATIHTNKNNTPTSESPCPLFHRTPLLQAPPLIAIRSMTCGSAWQALVGGWSKKSLPQSCPCSTPVLKGEETAVMSEWKGKVPSGPQMKSFQLLSPPSQSPLVLLTLWLKDIRAVQTVPLFLPSIRGCL